jgi:molecular chaperone DnaK
MNPEIILGIDLGTTNSEAAIIRDGQPLVVRDEDGDPILPSVVGLDAQGRLIVGRPARNQFVVAPERTVISIKRKMGEETTVSLGDQKYSPQEISAIILRTLKQRAEKSLGHEIKKAVITVPAFFGDAQRAATREAGELAGLEVVRIINEPTAAVLTYDPHPPEMERLLVYDLGGGTFDVSIAQVEAGVVEILASHGDTHLGGDDFDDRFLTHVADRFQTEHGIDLRESPTARGRLLRAVEDAKKALSFDAFVQIEQEFIAEKNGVPLHLKMEVDRQEYEQLIEPLLAKTLTCVDQALNDALLVANQINKVLLVGGATRTPLVQRLLHERLGRPVHAEIEPDLAVAMGAAVQGGLIAGVDVGAVLVDITPHTIGVEAVGMLNGVTSVYKNVPVIQRNTPLPARRTEIFTTVADGQEGANIRIFQGENEDTRYNTLIGSFKIEGLADVHAGNQIVVRLDLDLNGILNVTATERLTGLSRKVTIDNAMERFKANHRVDAVDRLEAMFDNASSDSNALAIRQDSDLDEFESSDDATEETAIVASARELMASAERMLASANAEDAAELTAMLADLRRAVDAKAEDDIGRIVAEVEDLVFYLKEN